MMKYPNSLCTQILTHKYLEKKAPFEKTDNKDFTFLMLTKFTLEYLDKIVIHSASFYGPTGMDAVTVNKNVFFTDLPGQMKVFKEKSLLILERGIILYFIYICLDRCWPSGFPQCSYSNGFAPMTMLCSLTPHMVCFKHCFCYSEDVNLGQSVHLYLFRVL